MPNKWHCVARGGGSYVINEERGRGKEEEK
jgi:hypothetical protein